MVRYHSVVEKVDEILDERMRNRGPEERKQVLESLYKEYAEKPESDETKHILKEVQVRIAQVAKAEFDKNTSKVVSARPIAVDKSDARPLFDAIENLSNAVKFLSEKVDALTSIDLPIVNITGDPQFEPKYANETDACLDLRAYFPNQQGEMWLLPGAVYKISSGLKVAIPEGYEMKMYVRSSAGIKKGLSLANQTGVIDAGYRDEIIMAIRNDSQEAVQILYGERICQFDIQVKVKVRPHFVADDEAFRLGNRGGGIGSTGEI